MQNKKQKETEEIKMVHKFGKSEITAVGLLMASLGGVLLFTSLSVRLGAGLLVIGLAFAGLGSLWHLISRRRKK